MNEPPLDELLPQGHQDMLNAYHEYMAQASDIRNQIIESKVVRNEGGVMNEVSIIINGVRYDAVQTDSPEDTCNYCDLVDVCNEVTTDCCVQLLPKYYRFKKSDKKFEV